MQHSAQGSSVPSLLINAPERPSNTAEAQRKRRACANYGENAAGKWVRKKAWRECDYTDGHLREFDTEGDFLAFEEERRVQGHCQAHYEKKPRDTVRVEAAGKNKMQIAQERRAHELNQRLRMRHRSPNRLKPFVAPLSALPAMPPKGVQAAMPKISPGVAKMIEAFNEFGPGVPATDKVCKELLKVLEVQWQQTHDNGVETPWLHNEEAKDDYALVFHINEDYCVEIGKREEENGALSVNAVFRHRRTLALVPPLIQGPFAPDGLREAANPREALR